jgi:hypothetical protein
MQLHRFALPDLSSGVRCRNRNSYVEQYGGIKDRYDRVLTRI